MSQAGRVINKISQVAAFCLVLLGLCIAGLVVSAADESPVLVSICSVGIALAVVLGFSGIVMLSPNEAAVLQLFGAATCPLKLNILSAPLFGFLIWNLASFVDPIISKLPP